VCSPCSWCIRPSPAGGLAKFVYTLAALRGEFFRESSHPPTSSVRLIACPFSEGEGDAQQVLDLEESASQVSGSLILAEIRKISQLSGDGV